MLGPGELREIEPNAEGVRALHSPNTGIIDFIETQPDGSLVIRDWKANVHDEFIARYARQLQVYVHALRTQQQTVSRAELVDVAASTKAKTLVTTDVDVSDATVSRVMNDCQDALHAIREGTFQPTPSVGACGSCDVRRICAMREGEERAKTEN